jgi:predicted metal-binding protein
MKLIPVDHAPAVVVCSTCRFSKEEREDEGGRRGGALLLDALVAAQAAEPAFVGVAVQAMPCLFACTEFCTVHLRGPGKVGYVMGRFAPDADAAHAILDYAARFAASETGQVPFREWPAGVKGHFITRTPPEGFVVE